MATATMATAAGAAMVLYFVVGRRLLAGKDSSSPDEAEPPCSEMRRSLSLRPAQPPSTWREAVTTLSETLRFTYSETLGKWPIGDLAFGIKYLMRRQGNKHVASVYAGENCVKLEGPEIMAELTHLLRLLTLCMFFSKKPFPVFLDSAGFTQDDVLLQEPKAGLLKPAFTIICDKMSGCFLLLIRGTHSIKDTLTAVTGAVVPFHHSVVHEGGISNLVLGYAHCGMVAAARWIAKCTTPCLLKAANEFPDYKIKVVGHSLGGGTAAILTYILREQKEFASTTCVTFAPAACMTWDLAESGKHFVTTIINGSDLVPTFSAGSFDDLRSEVTSSSWLNDLRDHIEHTRFLNVLYRSASALGAHLPSISNAKAKVAGAGALLQPVSSSTQVMMKGAQNVAQAVVRTRSSLSAWTCMGARRRTVGSLSSPKELADEPYVLTRGTSETLIENAYTEDSQQAFCPTRISVESEEELTSTNPSIRVSVDEEVSEGELWLELEKELNGKYGTNTQAEEEAAAAAKEITEEEHVVLKEAACSEHVSSLDSSEVQSFYPPGQIMHMVAMPTVDMSSNEDGDSSDESIGIYETPRDLYSKLRLSRTMINDHYMPMYKKMMELLIQKLQGDMESCIAV